MGRQAALAQDHDGGGAPPLHDFARDARLTEVEFHQACGGIAKLGQLNNGDQGPTDTTANLRGPFGRMDSPQYPNGACIVRPDSPVPSSGVPIFVNAWVRDQQDRHNVRPAHIHFMIHQPGFKTQFSQVYSSDAPNLEADVQFGVTPTLSGFKKQFKLAAGGHR